jgi:hypothetical protein
MGFEANDTRKKNPPRENTLGRVKHLNLSVSVACF